MAEESEKPELWQSAVSDVSDHVLERARVEHEAESKQRPKAKGPRLAILTVLLLGAVVWDVRILLAPAAPMMADQEAVHLAWFVHDVVDVIEDFEAAAGQLPTAADLEDVLVDGMTYTAVADGYMIVAKGDLARVEYSSEIPILDWVSIHARAEASE